VRELSTLLTRSTLAVALATVMIGLLMMITRKKAVTQIIGFLAMENGLFFAATSATYGMPLVVELGVALDVLIAAFVFGIFFFHIHSTFDSLDVEQMARLKEED
jgi:hydrogenase-4 component E